MIKNENLKVWEERTKKIENKNEKQKKFHNMDIDLR